MKQKQNGLKTPVRSPKNVSGVTSTANSNSHTENQSTIHHVKRNKSMANIQYMPRSSVASCIASTAKYQNENDQSGVSSSVNDDSIIAAAQVAQEHKKFELQTRKYVENSLVVSSHQKLLTNARFSAQGGLTRRKSKTSISGAVVDTGLRYQQQKNSKQQEDGNPNDLSSMSFYERKRKQKQLMDELHSLQQFDDQQARIKKSRFTPNINASQRSHRSSPSDEQRTNQHEDGKASASQNFLRNFKVLHNDIVIKPLEANIRRQQEAENKQILDEIFEKEQYEQEYRDRKNYYQKMRKTTYSKELAKLDRSPEQSSVNYMSAKKDRTESQSGKKTTFRKQIHREEINSRPQISKNTGKYLKRPKSTGNICLDLYQDSLIRKQRRNSAEKETQISLKNLSQSSVLENAGLSKVNHVRNSDRYLALKLTREFDQVLESMKVQDGQKLDKTLLLNLLVQLKMLKSTDQQNSDFIQAENMSIFQSVWCKLGGIEYQEESDDQLGFEKVRYFFLNLHYLWGAWLSRDRLFAKEKKPDRRQMEPQILKQQVLHSVPRLRVQRGKQEQQVELPLQMDQESDMQNVDMIEKYQSQGCGGIGVGLSSERYQNSEYNYPQSVQNNEHNKITTSDSIMDITKQTINDESNRQKSYHGAKSETECRKLINDFNLLNINRHMILKQQATLDQQKKSDWNIISSLQDRPVVSSTSSKLAKRKKRRSSEVTQSKMNLLDDQDSMLTPFSLPQQTSEQDSSICLQPMIISCKNGDKSKLSDGRKRSSTSSQHRKLQKIGKKRLNGSNAASQSSTKQAVQVNAECTFRPKLIAQHTSKSSDVATTLIMEQQPESHAFDQSVQEQADADCSDNIQEELQGIQIGQRLHQKVIKAHQTGKGKTKDEVDFEKNLQEMTFKPKILHKPTPYRQPLITGIKSSRSTIMQSPMGFLAGNKDRSLEKAAARLEKDSNRLRQEYQKMLMPKKCQLRAAKPSTTPKGINRKQAHKSKERFKRAVSDAQLQFLNPYNVEESARKIAVEQEQYQQQPLQANMNLINRDERNSVACIDLASKSDDHSAKISGESNKMATREVRLLLDVNLGRGLKAKLLIYEGDDYYAIVDRFSEEHSLTDKKKTKLLMVIEAQIQSQQQQMMPAVSEEGETDYHHDVTDSLKVSKKFSGSQMNTTQETNALQQQ